MKGRIRCLLAAVAMLAAGCGRGEPSFLSVTFCLPQPGDVEELKKLLTAISHEHGMVLKDGSSRTEQESRLIEQTGIQLDTPNPVINIGIWRDDELAAGVATLAGRPNQVAIGFVSGAHAGESRRFAESVVADLSKKWKIIRIPAGQTVFPLEDCDIQK